MFGYFLVQVNRVRYIRRQIVFKCCFSGLKCIMNGNSILVILFFLLLIVRAEVLLDWAYLQYLRYKTTINHYSRRHKFHLSLHFFVLVIVNHNMLQLFVWFFCYYRKEALSIRKLFIMWYFRVIINLLNFRHIQIIFDLLLNNKKIHIRQLIN